MSFRSETSHIVIMCYSTFVLLLFLVFLGFFLNVGRTGEGLFRIIWTKITNFRIWWFFFKCYIVQYFDRTETGEKLVPSMVCVLVLIPTETGTMNGAVSMVHRFFKEIFTWMFFIHYFSDLAKRFFCVKYLTIRCNVVNLSFYH